MSRVPPRCARTMGEVRAGVDAVDRALIALLAERFAYMDAAARIKDSRAAIRDEARKREVIGNVCREAAAYGLDAAFVAELWDRLVEASIAHEYRAWDRQRRGSGEGAASGCDGSGCGQERERTGTGWRE